MTTTFKQFLTEGGRATAKFKTERASADEIKSALAFVSKVTGTPVEELRNDLLGSTRQVLLGKKKDAGDVDIAFSLKNSDPEKLHAKMMKAVNNEGSYQSGSKIGSYAVPLGKKKIQVDFMFVDDKDWAKFMFHSPSDSKYPGGVRNIILLTALAHTQVPGKDFVIRNDAGDSIVRASHSIYLGSGMRRLFKVAKVNQKTGKRNKTLDTVTPEELEAHLKEIGADVKFSHDLDFTNNPDTIASYIFGKGTKAKDVMSAEQVIALVKKMKNAAEVIKASKSELQKAKLPVPDELN